VAFERRPPSLDCRRALGIAATTSAAVSEPSVRSSTESTASAPSTRFRNARRSRSGSSAGWRSESVSALELGSRRRKPAGSSVASSSARRKVSHVAASSRVSRASRRRGVDSSRRRRRRPREGAADCLDRGEIRGRFGDRLEPHGYRSKESTSRSSSVSPWTYVGPPITSIVTVAGAKRSDGTSEKSHSRSSKTSPSGQP